MYWELQGFADIYLEDSYVLSIHEEPRGLIFDMEIVLRESHAQYHPPIPGERYCYSRGQIAFDDVRNIEWIERRNSMSADANGDRDLGNIDTLFLKDGWYFIDGDWGRVKVQSRPPAVRLA